MMGFLATPSGAFSPAGSALGALPRAPESLGGPDSGRNDAPAVTACLGVTGRG